VEGGGSGQFGTLIAHIKTGIRVSIFESLWRQTELYEQLKIHDKMQKEFINITAHELRTPVQSLLVLTEVLYSKAKDIEEHKLLDSTIKSAKRLQRLSNVHEVLLHICYLQHDVANSLSHL
jgi:signal transduction histidine kinase